MSSKLRKWYVVVGMVVGGLVICSLLVVAGGVAGYMAARQGRILNLPGSWGVSLLEAPSRQGPGSNPQGSQPGQVLPEAAVGSPSGRLRGALIVEVESGTPADEVGLETGDIVIAVNNKGMDEDRDLAALIGSYDPGDEVVLTIVRQNDDTELMELEVTLGSDADEEGNEVALLGATYQTVSSGMGGVFRDRGTQPDDGNEMD